MRNGAALVVLLIYGSLTAVAFLIGYLYDNYTIWLYPGVEQTYGVFEQIGIGIGIGIAISSAILLAEQNSRWMQLMDEFLGVMLGSFGTVELILLILLGSVAEELMFRGALQPAIGLGMQAALFAILHTGPARLAMFMLPWTVTAFVSGVVLGVLFESTGTLLAPIAAHLTINAIGAVRMRIRYNKQELRTPDEILEQWRRLRNDGK